MVQPVSTRSQGGIDAVAMALASHVPTAATVESMVWPTLGALGVLAVGWLTLRWLHSQKERMHSRSR